MQITSVCNRTDGFDITPRSISILPDRLANGALGDRISPIPTSAALYI